MEASLLRLEQFLVISASLQRRRWPDEAIWDGRKYKYFSQAPYRISRCEYDEQLEQWNMSFSFIATDVSRPL